MIAIAGGKGGSGKTTTALGLAAAFARRGREVIVVDADVDMPDLHTLAGTSGRPSADAIATGGTVQATAQRSMEYPGVGVIAAPTDSRALEAVADRLAERPELGILDTPAGASIDVCRPLSLADRAILVTTPTAESVRDAAKTAELARQLGTDPIGTVVSRSDGSTDPTPLLAVPTLAHVPAVSTPGRAPEFRAAFDTCVRAVSNGNV